MDTAAKIAVGFIGVIMLVVWGRILVAPQEVADTMFLLPNGAAGLNTFRADVGGLMLGTGLLALLSLKTKNHQWLLAASLMMACAALGRLTGIILDGSTASSITSVGVEVVLVAILFGSAQRFKKMENEGL